MDENWIHTHCTVSKCRQSDMLGAYISGSSGQCLIPVNAG